MRISDSMALFRDHRDPPTPVTGWRPHKFLVENLFQSARLLHSAAMPAWPDIALMHWSLSARRVVAGLLAGPMAHRHRRPHNRQRRNRGDERRPPPRAARLCRCVGGRSFERRAGGRGRPRSRDSDRLGLCRGISSWWPATSGRSGLDSGVERASGPSSAPGWCSPRWRLMPSLVLGLDACWPGCAGFPLPGSAV